MTHTANRVTEQLLYLVEQREHCVLQERASERQDLRRSRRSTATSSSNPH